MILHPRIHQSEQQLVDIFESIDDGFFMMDKDLVITYANKAFEHHSGSKRKHAIGKNVWRVFPHVAYPGSLYKIHYEKVLKERKPTNFEHFNTRKGWVQIKAFPTKEQGVAVFIRDITDGVEAQKKLEDSEYRFRVLTSLTTDMVFRASPDWEVFQRVDDRKFRNQRSTAKRAWVESFMSASSVTEMQTAIKKAMKQKTPLSLEFSMQHPEKNSLSWKFIHAAPIMDEKGNVTEWFGAVTDISERRKQSAIRERMNLVTEQRNALIKLNKAKDEFVAIASHQLRTPATAVKQYMGMLLNGFAGKLDDSQQKLLQSAYDANERELELINDLLKTAQIDGTSHNIKSEPSNFVELLRSTVTELKSTADHRDQQIHFQTTRNTIMLPIDATEIKLAFSNLIENAIKYSHTGSDIIVKVKLDKKFVEASVIDHGVGISAEHQHQIFDKFTRIRNDLTDVVHGTGLGLYWVKKIVEMHGGTVTITSKLNKGSTFTVRLPRYQ